MTRLIAGLFTAFLLLLPLGSLPARADTQADIALFQQRYTDLHEASASRDKARMKAMLADGFTSIDLRDKQMTGDQLVDLISAAPKTADLGNNTEVISVAITGQQAEVKQRYKVTGTKKASDGSDHAMEMMSRSRDLWVQQNGQWLLKETRTDEMELKADGKRIFYQLRPGS